MRPLLAITASYMGYLRTLILVGAAFALTVVANTNGHSAPDLLAKWHFAGTSTGFADTNAAKLKKISELPASVDLREELLNKAAGFTLPGRGQRGGGAPAERRELIRPLLDDVVASESVMELRRSTNGPGEFLFAIRLGDERAGVWSTNLYQAVAKSFGAKPTSKTSSWELVRKESPSLVRFVRVKDWVVFGVGDKELPLSANIIQMVEKNGRPPKLAQSQWLQATVDWTRLQVWMPRMNLPFKPALMEISLVSKSDDLRTTVRAVYPDKLNWKPQQWQIPINLIKDPIISFTAGQSLSTFLNPPKVIGQTGVDVMNSQVYGWAQTGSPFHSFGAVVDPDAKGTIQKLSKELPARFNPQLEKRQAGKLVWMTNRNEISWQGIPILVPFLTATNTKAGSFLFGGFFPPVPLTNAPPSELFQQVIGRTNLVYYDWEITQERMGQWKMLSLLLPLQSRPAVTVPEHKASMPTNNPAKLTANAPRKTPGSGPPRTPRFLYERWFSAVSPLLGNTVTEITVTGANELTFVRKSPIGLTGYEITKFGQWFSQPAVASPGQSGKVQPEKARKATK